jgi:OmpA-OmpF porin, OOP family
VIRRVPLVLVAIGLPLLVAACGANLNELRAVHSGFEVELQQVGNKGARTCAPLAYAKAEAEHVFAAIEFAQGDVLKAQRHMDEARKYLEVAKVATQGCRVTEELPTADTRVAPTYERATVDTGMGTDSDGDGMVDAEDRCPSKAEDFDGFSDTDGCPDTDNDSDGIADVNDLCPDEPEDLDGVDDTDGCIDPDDDGDGIADVNDLCPKAAETFNGLTDEDGCPDEALSRIKVDGNQIVLLEAIQFQGKTPELNAGAFLVLSELSVYLDAYGDIRIRIETHTDSAGEEGSNQTLTEEQSRAIRDYLASQGVSLDRMETQGYGARIPIDTNRTESGRAANRRVEIYIIH